MFSTIEPQQELIKRAQPYKNFQINSKVKFSKELVTLEDVTVTITNDLTSAASKVFNRLTHFNDLPIMLATNPAEYHEEQFGMNVQHVNHGFIGAKLVNIKVIGSEHKDLITITGDIMLFGKKAAELNKLIISNEFDENRLQVFGYRDSSRRLETILGFSYV